jgi:hypothetical protein
VEVECPLALHATGEVLFEHWSGEPQRGDYLAVGRDAHPSLGNFGGDTVFCEEYAAVSHG